LDKVKYLLDETIDKCYPAWYGPEVIAYFKEYHSREQILNRARNGYMLVAFETDLLVGIGAVIEQYVSSVYIRESYQGKGVGKKIITELLEYASMQKTPRLTLDATPGSVVFYKSFGFKVLEEKVQWVNEKFALPYSVMEKVF
jgi:GNAT superfamily N-acetyltransferase